MPIVNFPVAFPYLFWIIALFWSGFQAYAGFQYGLYIFNSAFAGKEFKPSETTKWLAYGIQHGALYFLCTLSGFTAWSLVHLVSERLDDNTGAILIALAVFIVLGVSGALPRILYLGQKPI